MGNIPKKNKPNNTLSSPAEHQKVKNRLKLQPDMLAPMVPRIFNSMTDSIEYLDSDYTILWANRAASHILNLKTGDTIGLKCYEVWCNRDEPCRNCPVMQTLKTGAPASKKVIHDSQRHWQISTYPVIAGDNGEIKIVKLTTDITDTVQNQKYEALFDNLSEGVYIITPFGKYIKVNPAFVSLMGYDSKDELMPEDAPKKLFVPERDKSLRKNDDWIFETKIRKKDGSLIDIEVNLREIHENGAIKYYQGITRDITERKKIFKRLNYLSFHDSLTRLYNRAYFEEELKRLNTKRQLPLTFIIGDVNNLKLVNDAFGHKSGDKLIKDAAKFLREYFRKEDIVARWGGDEFTVLLPKTKKEDAEKIIGRIEKYCRNMHKDQRMSISISFGIATVDGGKKSSDMLLKEAEENMYHKKMVDKKFSYDSFMHSLEKERAEKGLDKRESIAKIKNLAVRLGRELKLSPNTLEDLSILAEVYDIGKVTISKSILFKKEKLTKKEFEEVKRHAEVSYNILKSGSNHSHITEDALYHHEWWDGSGYPQGLKGEEIPILARIIAIVEAFVVMVTGTEYKEAISKEEAISELKKSAGTQFDSAIVKKFVGMIG